MQLNPHLKRLTIVSVAWAIFFIGGLPYYYQQYSTMTMLLFDLAILPPIWLLIYRSTKRAGPGRSLEESLWWAFYISVPLCIYDYVYVGLYLGEGFGFLGSHWYLTVYYVLPWILFPLTGARLQRAPSGAQAP